MSIIDRLRSRTLDKKKRFSFIRALTSGSFINVSEARRSDTWNDISNIVSTMRALAQDSQVSIALSYYATDATTSNSMGQIIWATSEDAKVSEFINDMFKAMNINAYARSHILELATYGNMYMPTSIMYADDTSMSNTAVALNNNTIPDDDFKIIPSSIIQPDDVLHIWLKGEPQGYMYKEDTTSDIVKVIPEEGIIHFSLGGLLGKYTISAKNADGDEVDYDVQFADPLMENTAAPTRTLALLENATLLSSFSRVLKFINVDCTGDEDEDSVRQTLETIKGMIEQQMSANTSNGDAQSYLNPQSPNNLIFLAKVNGQDAISITDLNMADSNEADNKLLDYFQNKKLSTLGVPKEAMNYSSAEGLGNAGTVMSQRSALYANILDRLETAYKSGWTQAFNTFFRQHSMSGFVDKFTLHMNPIITNQQTVMLDKRDSAMNQVQTFIQILQNLGVRDADHLKSGVEEILTDSFPTISADVAGWDVDMNSENAGGVNGGI